MQILVDKRPTAKIYWIRAVRLPFTTMNPTIDLEPADLGLPEKFASFRPQQKDGIARINDHPGRYIAVSMPTGGGKSLLYIGAALFAGYRVCVLTMTKALQTQLIEDFGAVGLTDCRGRANFSCLSRQGANCEIGSTAGCRKAGACPYRIQLEEARAAQLVVTNLSYWIAMNHHSDGLGHFDLLIIDEAHESPEAVCSAAAIEITEREIGSLLKTHPPHDPTNPGSWQAWSGQYIGTARGRIDSILAGMKTGLNVSDTEIQILRSWQTLADKLASMATMTGKWAVEESRIGWRIEPLIPAEHAERLLFLGIDRILLVSATMTAKTLTLLGLPDPGRACTRTGQTLNPADLLYLEYPSDFPPQRNWLTYIPCVSVRADMGEGEAAHWLRTIDDIIRTRTDRKGIIHTTSYTRAKLILARSAFSHMMVSYTGARDAQQVIDAFKESTQPCILIGPSVTTGYDFPGTQCEYQILVKVPFPDSRSPILKARCEQDKLYAYYLTMQTLVQTCGRPMRSKMDQCENFIVDDNIRWFMARNGNTLAPKWFRRTYRTLSKVPPPLPKLK